MEISREHQKEKMKGKFSKMEAIVGSPNRLKELASIFPDLRDHLLSISNNLVDLADPFKNKNGESTCRSADSPVRMFFCLFIT